MAKEIVIVAVSGGLDSCVTAAIASENYELAFAHFNYGQRTERRELRAFNEIADFYNVDKRLIVDFPHFLEIGGSSLTDRKIKVPRADIHRSNIPNTYVPFRNANILCACVSWAEVIGAGKVFIGAVHEDSSGYPDCRPRFFEAFNKVVETGTKPETQITIETPIIHLSKSEIIQRGIELNAPLHLSWSCYTNDEKACGVCDSCMLRLRGFHQTGKKDLITYI